MDIKELESEYQNFYAPRFQILVGENGETDILDKGVEVTNVSVDNSLDGADTFSFTVFNAFDITKKEVLWFGGDDSLFKFGEQVEIKLGYANNLKTLMIGLITAVKVDFPSGSPPQMEVSGFDLSYKMMKEKKPRFWNDRTDSYVAEKIAEEHSFKTSFDDDDGLFSNGEIIEDSEVEYSQIIKQEKESDFEFLRRLAERNYYDFFVFGKTLFFRKPAYKKEEAVVTLEWGKSLVSFSPEIDIAERVMQINVEGANNKEKKDIVAMAAMKKEEITKYISFDNNQFTVEWVNHTLSSEQHAETLAKSILLKRHENVFTGSGESIGIPDIVAGKNIKLIGLGEKFSQKYYVNQTNHSISSSGYKTTFNVKILPDSSKIDLTSKTIPLSSEEEETEPDQNQGATEEIIPDPMIR